MRDWEVVALSRRMVLGGAAGLMAAVPVRAQSNEVKIGILFPLSRANAQIGIDAGHAFQTALDVIHDAQPDLDLPLAKGTGLSGFGGRRIRLVTADHMSEPQKGAQEAERLIKQEQVCAIVGSYQSAVGAAISQTCERFGLPYMAADNSSPSLTRRGLRFIFRASPHDEMFSRTMFDFMDVVRAKGLQVTKVGLIYEGTIFGTDSSNTQRRLAGERGYQIAADIRYPNSATSLKAEIEQLKAADPDVLLPTSYTADATLMIRTMAELGYRPRNILAQNAGFSDRALYEATGQALEGCVTRGAFSPDLARSRPAIARVNAMFRARAGKDLGDLTSRQFTALMILADAIDRARSTDGGAIRDALAATDLPGHRTIMPWRSVQFDESGQNQEADPVLLQWTGGRFVTIHPVEVAAAEARWPMNAT